MFSGTYSKRLLWQNQHVGESRYPKNLLNESRKGLDSLNEVVGPLYDTMRQDFIPSPHLDSHTRQRLKKKGTDGARSFPIVLGQI